MPYSRGLLDDSAPVPQFARMFKALAGLALHNRHFSWLFKLLLAVPRDMVRLIASAAVIDSMDLEDVSFLFKKLSPRRRLRYHR